MEIIGEILVEFLTGLADFDERKYPPFGLRYWLGWLGVLIHVLLLALLTCVTVFFFKFFLDGKGLINVVVAVVFLLFALFWLWKIGKTILKMWQATIYYLYSMKIKSSLGNEVEDRTGVHQGKLTTDNFDFRRVLAIH